MRFSTVGLVLCWPLAGGLAYGVGAPAPSASRPGISPPVLLKTSKHKGHVYRQYRHPADAYFKGVNVKQRSYEFLVRLPRTASTGKASAAPPMVVLLHSRSGDYMRHERRWPDHVVLIPDDNTVGIGHSAWFGYHALAPKRPKPDTVVVPYTHRRLIYYLQFALRELGVDPNRIWITGRSMGGGGALLFALLHPEWVVGTVAEQPHIDMRALPAYHPIVEKVFGPRKWNLKVAGTGVGVWHYTSIPWLLSERRACRTWLSIRHGRRDKVVRFEQYYTSVSPPGQSVLQLLEQGAAPAMFVWDMSGHGETDPIGTWWPEFAPLETGLIRRDRPSFAFSNPSLGHFGVPEQAGVWKTGRRPDRDSRGMINGFCRWDGEDLVDHPNRLEVSLWLLDTGPVKRRCPVETMTYSVSPRGTRQFPIPAGGEFQYRTVPSGPRGRVTANRRGVLTLRDLPLRRGHQNAIRLAIRHAPSVPVVNIASPTHPNAMPRATTTVIARWSVANSSNRNPMPVDRYRCWLAASPSAPPPPDSETPQTERVFGSLQPGRYHLMAQARLITGRWGPITTREVNISATSPVR